MNRSLWIALLIACVIHLLVILEVKINLPEPHESHNPIEVTLIKTSLRKSASKPPVVASATESETTPETIAQIDAQIKQMEEQIKKEAIADKKQLASRKYYEDVMKKSISKPKPPAKLRPLAVKPKRHVVAKKSPIIEPRIEVDSPVPVEAIESTQTVEPVIPSVPESEPVPIPTPEVAEPVATEPVATEKTVVPAEVSEPETIDKTIEKPVALPIKPTKKTAKKSGKKVSKKGSRKKANAADNQPLLSMDDLAAQVAQVGEKYGTQAPTRAESRVKKHKYSADQYISDWNTKVERIATLNYPEAAKQKDFSAQLVMEVGIKFDGSIDHISIKKSSGSSELDEAAKNIVRMGAPYPDLPRQLADEEGVLVFRRVWQFSDESGMTSR